jgi:hypothetical protein
LEINDLRIDGITSNSAKVIKPEQELEYKFETLGQYDELFDKIYRYRDGKTEIINTLLDKQYRSSDDISWVRCDKVYPRDSIDDVMENNVWHFINDNPSWIESATNLNKCISSCHGQFELFNEKIKDSSLDNYIICDKITKDLEYMIVDVIHAMDNYCSHTKLCYKYVLDSIKSVKDGADYIINLIEGNIACSIRSELLEREVPRRIEEIVKSLSLTNYCISRINNNKNHVTDAFQHLDHIKFEMRCIILTNNDFIYITKQLVKRVEEIKMEFNRMKNENISLESRVIESEEYINML